MKIKHADKTLESRVFDKRNIHQISSHGIVEKKNAGSRASEIFPALQYRAIHNGGIYCRVHKSILFRWESHRDIV